MFPLLHLLIFYNLFIWKPCVSYYHGRLPDRMRGKLTMLSAELLIDALSKVHSIQHYRKTLDKTKQFQYGSIVYKMRYRHRRMFNLYLEVLNLTESSPIMNGDARVTEEKSYMRQLAEVDTLSHEIQTLATMIQVYDANLYADKSIAGYDLFFRRINVAPSLLGLLDSVDDNDNNHPPGPPPPAENNLTHTSKRRNGLWHYAVPIQ